ncbi:hypothetical protein ABZQ21_31160, partial [Pseudomonas aeruginosa]
PDTGLAIPCDVLQLFFLANGVHRNIVTRWNSVRPTGNPAGAISTIKWHAYIEGRCRPFTISVYKAGNVGTARHIPGTTSTPNDVLVSSTEHHGVLHRTLRIRHDPGGACLVLPDTGLAKQ